VDDEAPRASAPRFSSKKAPLIQRGFDHALRGAERRVNSGTWPAFWYDAGQHVGLIYDQPD
jgi:hypothetical protein